MSLLTFQASLEGEIVVRHEADQSGGHLLLKSKLAKESGYFKTLFRHAYKVGPDLALVNKVMY